MLLMDMAPSQEKNVFQYDVIFIAKLCEKKLWHKLASNGTLTQVSLHSLALLYRKYLCHIFCDTIKKIPVVRYYSIIYSV